MQKRILDILQNTQKVIIGKERVTKLLLTALLADGHVLLEDVPGTGKTRLAKALVPAVSTGFSVATTKNGGSNFCVFPSIVT